MPAAPVNKTGSLTFIVNNLVESINKISHAVVLLEKNGFIA